jgi:sugar O-acyltransferase (sialic acid O-acetyltransferase NeuD family)
MKDRLLIIGASGHGKVVADIAVRMNNWQSIAFLDNDLSIRSCVGFDIIGRSEDAFGYIQEADIFVAIGSNKIRQKIQQKLQDSGASIPSLVHPNAIIGLDVEIGEGTAIMAGAIINSSTKIGKGCIINTGATLDHDNKVGDYVHISPGVKIAGSVGIGDGAWLGIGSVVSNNINIGNFCKLGAGAVVIDDISEAGTYVGVPARRI